MRRLHHVCLGGTAAQRLQALWGEPVLGLMDDCAMGPLADIDAPAPTIRSAFWSALYAGNSALAGMDWQGALVHEQEALAALAQTASAVVLWAGAHAAEQALRQRVHWWLRAADVPVYELLFTAADRPGAAAGDTAPVALLPLACLRSRWQQRQPLELAARQAQATAWQALRAQGQGVRVWDGQTLRECAAGHYDAQLLDLVGTQPRPYGEVLSQAMECTGRSDALCHWRYGQLLQAGHLAWLGAAPADGRSAAVCRAQPA